MPWGFSPGVSSLQSKTAVFLGRQGRKGIEKIAWMREKIQQS